HGTGEPGLDVSVCVHGRHSFADGLNFSDGTEHSQPTTHRELLLPVCAALPTLSGGGGARVQTSLAGNHCRCSLHAAVDGDDLDSAVVRGASETGADL